MESKVLSAKAQLAVILFIYISCASIFGYNYKYAINPDGISLIRLAGYIAEGNLWQSVSASWSPLITWLMAPFIYLGFEGLTAARIVIALSGGLFVVCSWLLALRFELSRNMRFIAVLIAALLISDWTIRNIGADILIASLLVWYFYLVTNPNILKDNKVALHAGIIGGLAYLAKNYALPFFIIHFPLMLLLRYHLEKKENNFSKSRLMLSLIIGISGFVIVSSIWVSILSLKYEEFTITGKAKIIKALMAPEDIRHPPMFGDGLHRLNNSYSIHFFEDTSGLSVKTWSPFESKKYFMHQLNLIKDNLNYIFDHFVNKSPFFTKAFVIGIIAFVPVILSLSTLNKSRKYLYIWATLTFVIYSSGYILFLARAPRRFYALMVIFLLMSFHLYEIFYDGLKNIMSCRRKKFLTLYFLVIIFAAFTIKPGIHLLSSIKNIGTIEPVNPYKEIADQVSTIEFPTPYAIVRSAQKAYTDYYLAYYLDKQFLGRPLSLDVDGITNELRSVDGKSLLVFDSNAIVENLIEDERYKHTAVLKLKEDKRYSNAVNIRHDYIEGWDREVNIFILR